MKNLTAQAVYNADIYLRLSDDDGDKPESNSIKNQREFITEFLKSMPEIRIHAERKDDGFSGVDFFRPGIQEVLQDVRSGAVNCVVVKDLSRLGRNYIETGKVLQEFAGHGVRFIAINDGYDTANAQGQASTILLPIKNLMNDSYSRDISVKIRSHLEVKKRKGQFVGAFAAYGYLKSPDDKNQLVVDDYAAEVVRDIFRWKLEGMSQQGIADRLNADGVLSPSEYPNYHRYLQGVVFTKRFSENSPWQTQTVKHILENPVYLGQMVQGKKITKLHAGQKQKIMPPSEWIIVPNTHEAIIEQELFDAVQAILKVKHEEYHSRLGKYAHFDSENIFEGLVVCACCQHNMTRYKSVYNKGRTVAYHFICPRHAMLLDAGCPNAGGLRESDLKAAVYEVLRLQMAMLTDAEAVIQRVSRSSAARSRRTALDNEIVSVQGRLKKLDTLRQTLFESYVDSIVTQADYLFGKSRYEDETRQLERCLQNLQAEKDALPEASPKQNKWFSVFAKFRYEKELSRKMLLALVEKIYVNEDKQVHIVLNYQDDMKKLFQEEV